MPITQPRMLDLLDAAQDYRQAVSQIIAIARDENTRVSTGQTSLKDSFEYLVTNMNPLLLLKEPTKSEITIILEAKHFKKFREQNIRKARKLRENREADRLGEPRPNRGPSSAPQSISEINECPKKSLSIQLKSKPKHGQMENDPDAGLVDQELDIGDTTVQAAVPPVNDAEINKMLEQHNKETEYTEKYNEKTGK